MPQLRAFLAYTFLTIPWFNAIGVYGQSNTTCASAQLDWYTEVVGETPCVTYQRLRQICNRDYQVEKFRSLTPGDNCDDQVSACCCNSVSWALSMLCMNCQYDTQLGEVGIDAGKGAFPMYLAGCKQQAANQTLPKDIQTAVCNKEIKIDRNLYNLFWVDGDWFYVYTKEAMVKDFAVTNNNTFTKCASTTRNETASSTTTSSSSTSNTSISSSNSSSSSTHIGPIVGGVVGGVLGAVALGMFGFFCWRRQRRRQGPTPIDLAREYNYPKGYLDVEPAPPSGVVPFSVTSPTGSGSRYGGIDSIGSTDPEQIALLARSEPGSSSAGGSGGSSVGIGGALPPSKLANQLSLSGHPGYRDDEQEPERHEDGGPVSQLQRSDSGRLPPAYRSWEMSQDREVEVDADASQWGSGPGTSSGQSEPGGGQGESGEIPLMPQYPTDVKRAPGPLQG